MHIINSHFHWWPRSVSERFCKRKTYPARRGQRPRRLHLSAPGRRRLRAQQLGRVVRPRQAARAHGRARPSGRRGVLDRAALGVLLRPAAGRGARLRHPVERGDGGRAAQISRPAVGERRGAAGGHQDRHRGARRRGRPARPDGRESARQHRQRCTDRRRAARAVLRPRGGARPADVPASRPTRCSSICSTATTARCI